MPTRSRQVRYTPRRVRLRRAARERVGRLTPAAWPLLQTAAASGLAWWICQELLHHRRPVFAAVTTIVAMGASAGRRGRQVITIVVATALGIGLGDLLLTALGAGPAGVAAVVLIAMTLAILIDPDPLFTTNVAISGMIFVAAERTQGLTPDRLFDGLVGGVVAIVFSVFLFPLSPVRHVLETAGPVLDTVRSALEDTATALRRGNPARSERARQRVFDHPAIADALRLGQDVTRIAIRRRGDRGRVLRQAAVLEHLPHIARTTHVLAGVAHRIVRERGAAPPLAGFVDELASGIEALGRWLVDESPTARDETRAHAQQALSLTTALGTGDGLAVGTLLHLSQSVARRLLLAIGDELPAQDDTLVPR